MNHYGSFTTLSKRRFVALETANKLTIIQNYAIV
jgi:hypothetical protein